MLLDPINPVAREEKEIEREKNRKEKKSQNLAVFIGARRGDGKIAFGER